MSPIGKCAQRQLAAGQAPLMRPIAGGPQGLPIFLRVGDRASAGPLFFRGAAGRALALDGGGAIE